MSPQQIRESYIFAQLLNVTANGSAVRSQLDGQLGDHQDLPGFCKLLDNTWELVVHQSYVTELCAKLDHHFPGCRLSTEYNPTEPSAAEVKRYGSRYMAQRCAHHEFMSRVELMHSAWPTAAIYYRLRGEEEEQRRPNNSEKF
jgi:hypothetical protein